MPTFSALSIVIAKASALSSIPVDANVRIVPSVVICVCAASTLKLCVVPSPVVPAVDVIPVPPVIVPT